jgi:hypothetical protein
MEACFAGVLSKGCCTAARLKKPKQLYPITSWSRNSFVGGGIANVIAFGRLFTLSVRTGGLLARVC